MAEITDPLATFIEAACVPLDASHGSGKTERADAILASNPEIARQSIYSAAILGDDVTVRQFVESDRSLASRKGGSRNWDALTYLCFSRYLRLDKKRSEKFVAAAKILLEAGASANTGWFEENHQPRPTFESAIYGAAGVAQHPGLTQLLLDHGADPNDDETPYHVPETWDNATLEVLLRSGKLNDDSLATLLLRKTDWHHYEGVKLLLENGADPNRITHWRNTALQHAALRDNSIQIFEVLLDHGADPSIVSDRPSRFQVSTSKSAVQIAAWRGRGDVLELFKAKGFSIELDGVEKILAECAMNHAVSSTNSGPTSLTLEDGGRSLALFAGNGNTDGVRNLLNLGVPVNAVFPEGDGYFDLAANSTALHSAAWRARYDTVKLLIERGADVNAKDAKGRTPLHMAIRACVDSYWRVRRKPDSVDMLLNAGASADGIPLPTGYDEIDGLIRRAQTA
jgi:ankyrin repeat protein